MTEGVLLSAIATHVAVGYVVFFMLLLVEGDVVLFLSAFLLREHIFSFWPVIAIAFSGVFSGDLLWFFIGGHAHRKSALITRLSGHLGRAVDEHILQRPFRTFFLSKFTYGFYRPIIMRAAAIGMPLRAYIRANGVASSAWIVLILTFGYIFSASIGRIRHVLGAVEITLAVALAGFILFSYFLSRQLRERI